MILLAVLCTLAFGQKTSREWFDQGNVLYEQGKYNDAIQAYDNAIALDPLYADPWNNKGAALLAQSKYAEAIKAYEKAIEINPQHASSWNGKHLACFRAIVLGGRKIDFKGSIFSGEFKHHIKNIKVDLSSPRQILEGLMRPILGTF